MKRWIWILAVAGCGGSGGGGVGGTAAVAYPNDLSPLGINLTTAGLASQTPEICFKDLFKQAGPWMSSDGQPFAGAAADGTPIPAPGQAAVVQMCRSLYGHYPGGIYHCLYEGSGTFQFGNDAAIVSQGAGEITVEVTPSNTPDGIMLRIASSSASDPLRNVRFVPAAYLADYETSPFHPDFLARWSRFKTIRFMNWQRTNTSTLSDWADRPTPAGQQTGPAGVALEYMIDLCNALHADPWFCMPFRATDGFVAQFASLVGARLDPTLRVYLEYANEAWNPAFAPEPYAEQEGLAQGLSADPYTAGRRFVVQRSVAMFAIWEQAFGGTERLVRTLSVFTGLPQNDLPDLDWQGASAHLDALAIGPYFSLNSDMGDATAISQMTVPEILDSCLANIDVVMSAVAQHRANASSRGLDLVAYEGGQNLVGRGAAQTDPTVIALFSAANRDPGMQGVYAYYMGQWRLMGGHQFCHFASMQQYDTVWGAFGIFEWNDQPTTPKYAALTEFITGDPRWW